MGQPRARRRHRIDRDRAQRPALHRGRDYPGAPGRAPLRQRGAAARADSAYRPRRRGEALRRRRLRGPRHRHIRPSAARRHRWRLHDRLVRRLGARAEHPVQSIVRRGLRRPIGNGKHQSKRRGVGRDQLGRGGAEGVGAKRKGGVSNSSTRGRTGSTSRSWTRIPAGRYRAASTSGLPKASRTSPTATTTRSIPTSEAGTATLEATSG